MTDDRVERARSRFRLQEIIASDVRLRRASGGWMGCCPFHRDKTPSFHVSEIRQTFKCFGCGAWGDVFDYLMLRQGCSFQEAVSRLLAGTETGDSPRQIHYTPVDRTAALEDEARRIHHAHELWLKREPLPGLALDYLTKTRQITSLPTRALELLGYVHRAYCSPLAEESPALVAPLQDRHGHVTAVQQIFLCADTLDAWRDESGRRIKRTLGVMRDGAVRLSIPVGTTLGLAGSVEDALAASHLFTLPVWAVCGEHRLSRVWIPDEIEHLVIFADADEAGIREARRCLDAYRDRTVEIAAPDRGKDWVDQVAS